MLPPVSGTAANELQVSTAVCIALADVDYADYW